MPDLTVWPTDGADGSVSSEARWRKMARLYAASGVRRDADLIPTLVAGPTINVSAGQAFIDGHLAELTSPVSVPAAADGILVTRFTPADNRAELLFRAGAGLIPTQTDASWELPLAQMSGGAMGDKRGILANAAHAVAVATAGVTVTAVWPALQAVPGAQIVLWNPGVYLVTCSFEMNVAGVSATTYAYGVLNASGCTPLAVGAAQRTTMLMAATCQQTQLLVLPVRVDTPASAVLNLQGAKSAAAGTFNISNAAIGTWISAVRIA